MARSGLPARVAARLNLSASRHSKAVPCRRRRSTRALALAQVLEVHGVLDDLLGGRGEPLGTVMGGAVGDESDRRRADALGVGLVALGVVRVVHG